MAIKELCPIRERPADYDPIELMIKKVFREKIYLPLIRSLNWRRRDIVLNSSRDPLIKAIESGKVSYGNGVFRGRFTAQVSKRLKELGAIWDAKTKSFRVPQEALITPGLTRSISAAQEIFINKVSQLDKQLRKILPEEIADNIRASDLFAKIIWQADQNVSKSLAGLKVTLELTDSERKRIAAEWQNNLDLYIKDFADKEIKSLREQVSSSVFAGDRYGALVKTIQKSYGVTERKAKFLARQETNLLVTKLKQVRYESAGIDEYRWRCVVGSPAHPVRPAHKALDGSVQRFDSPPITTAPGEPMRRNNPGQDYNCRCSARPLVPLNR